MCWNLYCHGSGGALTAITRESHHSHTHTWYHTQYNTTNSAEYNTFKQLLLLQMSEYLWNIYRYKKNSQYRTKPLYWDNLKIKFNLIISYTLGLRDGDEVTCITLHARLLMTMHAPSAPATVISDRLFAKRSRCERLYDTTLRSKTGRYLAV